MKPFADWLSEKDEALTERVKKWSGKVKTTWEPPEGLFTQSAEKIASAVARASDDLKQAVSRINFYKNRAGGNLGKDDIARLDNALELVRKKFGADKE